MTDGGGGVSVERLTASESERVRAEVLVRAGGSGPATPGRAIAVLVALVLAALVAALSAGLPQRVHGGGGLSVHALLGDAAALVLALALGLLCLIVYDEWRPRSRLRLVAAPRRRRRLARPSLAAELLLIPLVVLALSALVLAVALLGSGGGAQGGPAAAGASRSAPALAHRHAGATSTTVPFDGLLFVLAAVVVLILAGAYALRAWRRRRAAAPTAPGPDALVAAVDESLEDLERERDPRRAVIRAYERMERALAVHGIPRHPAETPLEYMRRALAALHAQERSVRRLTDLFEQARFSRHRIDAAMKQEALAALAALRDELAGTPAEAGARA